jgi:lipopolysaccharide transport system ATP-binding protein
VLSHYAIRADGLSKEYTIGAQRRHYDTFREALVNGLTAPFERFRGTRGRPAERTIWALKDVNFQIDQGEVVGIIGRNGAGKSTLLKILSRITMPTEGEVAVRGRVASLLEVGTGFHPELTGRENIFLNGAILGMTRREVRRKFDEIVDFADVERFIDTPVKHYSSGMYMRLAFAIAAHLETDVLLVDEVLAVGDAEFQKKCLGMMEDVSRRQGRTVILVSHNMEAVLKLCNRSMLFERGQIQIAGDVRQVLSAYLERHSISSKVIDLSQRPRRDDYLGNARLVQATTIGQERWSFAFGDQLVFEICVEAALSMKNIEIMIGLYSARGFEVATWTNTCSRTHIPLREGVNILQIAYQDLALLPGQYLLGISLGSSRGVEDYVPEAVEFEIAPSVISAQINARSLGGVIVPNVKISIEGGDRVPPEIKAVCVGSSRSSPSIPRTS